MSKKQAGRATGIYKKMADVLKANPQGLTAGEWREKLGLKADEQSQLDRRKRELKRWYVIHKENAGNQTRYFFKSERETPLPGREINQRDRAEILRRAHGRCGMCGKTIERHGIALVVDHKIPKDWGGLDKPENLWAICEECNGGKKNLFASQDQTLMKKTMHLTSVHVRIGETLKAFGGKPVPSYLIEFVADQTEWRKRLRELRYLGWKVKASTKKNASGKVDSSYALVHSEPWNDNPTGWIREFEKKRAEQGWNKKK